MQLHPGLKYVFENIDFLARYRNISIQYQDFDNRMLTDDINATKDLIHSLGYPATYNKSENFFKIIEKLDPFQFQFNISIKNGIVELIWDLKKTGERLTLGPWMIIAGMLDSKKVYRPVFKNHEELQSILKGAFEIYEDFKKETIEVLAQ